MKKHFLTLFMLCFVVLLCFVFTEYTYKPIDSLIRPPRIEGNNSDIQTAFENSVGSDYQLKSPLSGEYRTSFIRKDINADGKDEVIVLYTKAEAPDVVRINILKKTEENWASVSDIESRCSDIHQISFADLDNDNVSELIVCLRAFENEVSNTLNVYKIFTDDESKDFVTVFSKSYSEFMLCDVDRDDKTDIILFEKNAGNANSEIRGTFYNFSKEKYDSHGEFFLDPAISTIGAVCFDYDEYGDIRIYVDGYKTDTGMTTDLITWDREERGFFHLETYDYESIVTAATRSKNIYCSDINSDSLVEIPFEEYISQSRVFSDKMDESKPQSIIRWVQYDDYEFVTEQFELFNPDYNYSVVIPVEYFDDFTVYNDLSKGVLTFYELAENEDHINSDDKKPKDKKPKDKTEGPGDFEKQSGEALFSIFATTEQDYGIYELSGYRLLKTDNGFNYYYQLFDAGKSAGITKVTIKSILLT